MIDVNGTKFHLWLTRDDWARGRSVRAGATLGELWRRADEGATPVGQELAWNAARRELTLQPQVFQFTPSPNDRRPDLDRRRGAARDRYGNWYWIDETGTRIRVHSTGSRRVSDFYPTQGGECAEEEPAGGFRPVAAPQTAPPSFRGLAVTIDHYLVVGRLAPAPGLLIFDLYAAGPPHEIVWRDGVAFAPFDMAARAAGGVFVLDRANRRYWTLDRGFRPAGEGKSEPDVTLDLFQPFAAAARPRRTASLRSENFYSTLPAGDDPIAIEALPDDTVLILNQARDDEDFSVVYRYWRGRRLDALPTEAIKERVRPKGSTGAEFRLRGYDFAFVPEAAGGADDRLYIVGDDGNQAFAFTLVCGDDLRLSPSPELPATVVKKNFELQPADEYYPLRLYGGKGFAAASDGLVYYDLDERWLPLVKQRRPTYATEATLETEVFDGKTAGCVWHRLLVDGCLPAETKTVVYSRAAETEAGLAAARWRREPDLYLRGGGSELAYAPNRTAREKGRGTWELLFQNAVGRYLQLKLELAGNGQQTPRLSALRVYYPRFSYLDNYLPAVYRDDAASASFLDRFLANFEGFYTSIEERIAAVQALFDVRTAPAETLDWLARWFGVALDPHWSEAKRRLFISHAVEFFQYRGTARGLRMALRLALDDRADERIFAAPTAAERSRDPFRLVERFLTRRAPALIPADRLDAGPNLPRAASEAERWTPALGADVLNRLYGERLGAKNAVEFPLVRPVDGQEAVVWESFARAVLGFVPSASAADERRAWQNFLRDRYQNEIEAASAAHEIAYPDVFGEDAFRRIGLPHGAEKAPAFRADWRDYLALESPASRTRKLWQDFLARRYRRAGRLNELYGANWQSFAAVTLFDRLPNAAAALADWVEFERGVLPMHATAHRFTVLIPAVLNGRKVETAEDQARLLDLVRRLVELEKPAHTVCDYRYFWNLFRLEEVRLGYDTLLGLGSRDPLLAPPLVAGRSFVGEARVGVAVPERDETRFVLGNRSIEPKKKDGKP